MLNQTTVQTMNALKLFGMAKSFPERLADPNHAQLDHAEFVGLLIDDEKTHRESQRLKRLLKKARLRFPSACLEDVDYSHSRDLQKAVLRELSTTRWIEARRNVLITGPTGIGKSWIACALGNHAARAGFTVAYVRVPRLFETLQQSRGDGTHLKALNRLAKTEVVVLDDWLLTPMSAIERKDLLEIVEPGGLHRRRQPSPDQGLASRDRRPHAGRRHLRSPHPKRLQAGTQGTVVALPGRWRQPVLTTVITPKPITTSPATRAGEIAGRRREQLHCQGPASLRSEAPLVLLRNAPLSARTTPRFRRNAQDAQSDE